MFRFVATDTNAAMRKSEITAEDRDAIKAAVQKRRGDLAVM